MSGSKNDDDQPWRDRDGTDDPDYMPPPGKDYQREHGWKDGQPPPDAEKEYKPNGQDNGRIKTGAAFVATHVPPVWLIEGIVQRGRLYSCTSLTGHGKTAVWLFNACMIHAGRMIGHLRTFKSNVLFLAGENPADLEARMLGMAKAYKLPRGHLPFVLPGAFPLNEEAIKALKQDIDALGIPFGLIVGDTTSSFFPGEDDNANVPMGLYARTLRILNGCNGKPAIMMLSHPVKNATEGTLLPRGGGGFVNELDGNLTLWSEALGENTRLHWLGKIRGPDFPTFHYRLRPVETGLLDEWDEPEVTIIAEPMSEEAAADQQKQALANDDIVLRSMRDHPDWSRNQICREAGWVSEGDMPLRTRVDRSIKALAADKLIAQQRKRGPWSVTQKGQDVLKAAGL
jgi:hypothetical protein